MKKLNYLIMLGCLFLMACGGAEPIVSDEAGANVALEVEPTIALQPTTAVESPNLSLDEHEALYFTALLEDDLASAQTHLDAGVDVDATAESGFSGLQIAIARENGEMARLLLDSGASFEQDLFNEAMLYLGGSVDAAAAFLENGADVNVAESARPQHSPLMHAAEGNHVELGRFLLEQGADINQLDQYGDPALNVAAFWGSLAFAEMLVEEGAELDIAGYGSRTALGHAKNQNRTDVVEFLTAVGASE